MNLGYMQMTNLTLIPLLGN